MFCWFLTKNGFKNKSIEASLLIKTHNSDIPDFKSLLMSYSLADESVWSIDVVPWESFEYSRGCPCLYWVGSVSFVCNFIH